MQSGPDGLNSLNLYYGVIQKEALVKDFVNKCNTNVYKVRDGFCFCITLSDDRRLNQAVGFRVLGWLLKSRRKSCVLSDAFDLPWGFHSSHQQIEVTLIFFIARDLLLRVAD